MKKLLILALALVLMTSLLLSGCGQPAQQTESQPQSTEQNTEQTTEKEEPKPVKLLMTMWGSEKDTSIYQKRADIAKAKYNYISTEVVNVTGDYDQKIQTMIAGGTPPDIIELSETLHVYASKDRIIPLDDYIANEGIDMKQRFKDDLLELYKYNGKIYAMPDRAGTLILYYNKDMFDKAKVAYPTKDWTWIDMLNAAQKLTVVEGKEVKQWGFQTIGWWPYWMSFIYQNGGRILDDSGKPVFNTPQVSNALQFYNDLVFKYKVAPTPEDIANMGNPGPDQLFAQGKLAMELTGFWNIQSLMNVPEINWDICPMWGNKEYGTPAFYGGLCIIKDSQYKDEAFKVLEVMGSKEGQMPIVIDGEDVPANKEAMVSDEFLNAVWLGGKKQINMATFNDCALFTPPIHPKINEIHKVIGDNLSELFMNKTTVETTIEKIQKGLEELLQAN